MKIITDLDNCIVDDEWRYSWFVECNFEEYHRSSLFDNEPHMEHLLPMSQCDELVVVTGRPECYRKQTLSYMLKYGFGNALLFMRPNNDKRSTPAFKVATVLDNFNVDEIRVAYDDRIDVVEAYRTYGINSRLHAIHAR